MLTVACVLKRGPEYTPAHVAALCDGVRRHLSLPHRFVCLTDMAVDCCDTFPLLKGWPGWWSKIEMMGARGPWLYFDLDTIIVGSLDKIALGHRFTMLENFWRPDRVGSGMMALGEGVDLSPIYVEFARASKKYMDEYSTPQKWGDQVFIKDHTPIKPDLWQTKHPGKVVSYKQHVLKNNGEVPKGASVICYHGNPRPWTTPLWKAAKVAA